MSQVNVWQVHFYFRRWQKIIFFPVHSFSFLSPLCNENVNILWRPSEQNSAAAWQVTCLSLCMRFILANGSHVSARNLTLGKSLKGLSRIRFRKLIFPVIRQVSTKGKINCPRIFKQRNANSVFVEHWPYTYSYNPVRERIWAFIKPLFFT